MLQAILIGLIVFIGKADYFIGTAMFGRPLVLGALVGIVLGDIPTAVMIGFQMELRSLCRRQSCQRLLSICSMASLRRSWQRRRTALPRKVSI